VKKITNKQRAHGKGADKSVGHLHSENDRMTLTLVEWVELRNSGCCLDITEVWKGRAT